MNWFLTLILAYRTPLLEIASENTPIPYEWNSLSIIGNLERMRSPLSVSFCVKKDGG